MPHRALVVLVVGATLALGAWSEAASPQELWLFDFAVGVVYLVAGLVSWPREKGTAALLLLVSVTWYLGGLVPEAVYWHRAVLIQLLVAFPGWRWRTRPEAAVVFFGYALAVAAPTPSELVNAVFFVPALVVLAVEARRSVGERRLRKRTATWGAAALVIITCLGSWARTEVAAGAAVTPALLAYEAGLMALAVAIALDVRRVRTAAVTDLVVRLDPDRSERLPQALSWLLGDPTLEVGYWSSALDCYLAPDGSVVVLPLDDEVRVATRVDHEGPFAVLVHDRSVLDDPTLSAAVRTAALLTRANVELHAELMERTRELESSRRRLLMAADDERRDLERRLHQGPEARLVELASWVEPRISDDPHLARAQHQLRSTQDDLARLALGLHPRALSEGLAPALQHLVERSTLPTTLTVADVRLPPELEVAAWYVCSEALANVAKHASASSVVIEITAGQTLTVAVIDDGCGGADPGLGTGLAGLIDRVEGLGGTVSVESPAGGPTRVVADLPIGDHSS